jgi:hypothetical protein
MNTAADIERSRELAEAKGRHLAVQTNTRTLGWTSVLALLVGSTPNLAPAQEQTGLNVMVFGAVPATNQFQLSSSEVEDASLSAELTRVFCDLASRQVEMDAIASRVLYSRMRDLYRR